MISKLCIQTSHRNEEGADIMWGKSGRGNDIKNHHDENDGAKLCKTHRE